MPVYYRAKRDFNIIPYAEVERMIRATKEPRMRALLALVWLSGARISELLALKKDDFIADFEHDELRITINTVKGGAIRELKFSIEHTPLVKNIVLPYLDRVNVRLFSFGVRRAEQLLYNINEKTGYWYTFHEFRHSRLTFLARKLRASTAELMDWTGWKSPKQVGTYLIREASERFKDKIR